jgi:alpha-L-rhamnosidase
VAKRSPADWGAQWIGADASLVVAGVHGPGHPAVYLRGCFDLPEPPIRAIASFAGLGWGKLYVNGAEASSLELSPGYTTYEYRTQFNVLDVTPLLARPGRIALAAVLGDGWYSLAHDPSCCAAFQFQRYVNSTRMLLDVDLWFPNGSHARVSSNASWQWALGEITSSWLAGESVDKARALPGNWSTDCSAADAGDFHSAAGAAPAADSVWRPVVLLDGPPALFNGSVMTAQKEPPTLRGALFEPQTLRVAPEPNATSGSVYIFDLGREIQGRPVVTASSNSPALLRILVCGSFYLTRAFTCDESTVSALNAGNGPSLYNFSLAGNGAKETYEPFFTYAAIRRVVVHVPGGVGAPACAVRMLAMDQPAASSIVTSSDAYNWLHAALARTQVHYTTGFPNDPSRERVGYTQDVENMFRGAAFEFASSERMYSRWLTDMVDGQAYAYMHPGSGIPAGAGQMPTVIPGPKSDNANSVFWGGMLVWLPWRHFLHYGDARVLSATYDSMAAYVRYLNASAPGNIVAWGLADWNSPVRLLIAPQHKFPTLINPHLCAIFDPVSCTPAVAGVLGLGL